MEKVPLTNLISVIDIVCVIRLMKNLVYMPEKRGDTVTIEEILSMEEGQVFDRKSIAIHATALSDVICAFANADGGKIAIGISDKTRTIEGVDYENDKLNDLLRVPVDYCNPSVQIKTEMIPCTDFRGRDNHILLMHIEASTFLHANHADEVFQRIGDKSKKLSFEDRMTLMYDKGLRFLKMHRCWMRIGKTLI